MAARIPSSHRRSTCSFLTRKAFLRLTCSFQQSAHVSQTPDHTWTPRAHGDLWLWLAADPNGDGISSCVMEEEETEMGWFDVQLVLVLGGSSLVV